MEREESIWSIRFKVGIFTILGLFLVGAMSVFVNDRPFWWRPCQLIHINVPDATGLKTKSPVRSLGLQIGFLKSVQLYEDRVKLAICITAPVKVLPKTKASIRGEGFLGDKFVELKPVKYIGDRHEGGIIEKKHEDWMPKSSLRFFLPPQFFALFLIQDAFAQEESREVPVEGSDQGMQELVDEVDDLVDEIKDITKTLNYAIKPEELKDTLKKLNMTLDHAQKAFAPEGGMTTTAQRTLEKLEDAIEQFRDQMTKINQGKGSLGMLLNDPTYAEEIKKAIQNVNVVLGKVSALRINVNMGAEYISAYRSGRGGVMIGVWPQSDRYYLFGVAVDPRGRVTNKTISVTSSSTTTSTRVTETETGAILFTGMLGKVLWRRLDLSAGFLYGDGAVAMGLNFGAYGFEDRFVLITHIYAGTRNSSTKIDARLALKWFPSYSPYLRNIYVTAGLDAFRQINSRFAYSFGVGLSFDDRDIKMLFSFF